MNKNKGFCFKKKKNQKLHKKMVYGLKEMSGFAESISLRHQVEAHSQEGALSHFLKILWFIPLVRDAIDVKATDSI